MVKKVGGKETPRSPLGEKAKSWRKSDFCWRKKIHCPGVGGMQGRREGGESSRASE